jgi:hypothetical protein
MYGITIYKDRQIITLGSRICFRGSKDKKYFFYPFLFPPDKLIQTKGQQKILSEIFITRKNIPICFDNTLSDNFKLTK